MFGSSRLSLSIMRLCRRNTSPHQASPTVAIRCFASTSACIVTAVSNPKVNNTARPESYGLHDLTVSVECEHSGLHEHVSDILLYKGLRPLAGEIGSSDIDLRVEVGGPPSPPPVGAEPLGEFGPDLDTYREDDNILLIGPSARVQVDTVAHTILASYDSRLLEASDSNAVRQTIYHPLIFGLWTLLRGVGYFGLHAAALAKGDRGILLVAPSDSGKTTAALSLVQHGWRQVSDDAVLLRREKDVIRALTFRHDFSLDPEVLSMWPELRTREWGRSPSDPTKFRVDLREVYPDAAAPRCTPEVVVVPKISAKPESSLSRMPKREALHHVIAQSTVTVAPIQPWVAAHMQVISELVQQVATYRLESGRDVLDDPVRFSALLERCLRSH